MRKIPHVKCVTPSTASVCFGTLSSSLLLLLLSRFSRVRLCDPRDSSPPGSPIPGILQARPLAWVAITSLLSDEESISLNFLVLSTPSLILPPRRNSVVRKPGWNLFLFRVSLLPEVSACILAWPSCSTFDRDRPPPTPKVKKAEVDQCCQGFGGVRLILGLMVRNPL